MFIPGGTTEFGSLYIQRGRRGYLHGRGGRSKVCDRLRIRLSLAAARTAAETQQNRRADEDNCSVHAKTTLLRGRQFWGSWGGPLVLTQEMRGALPGSYSDSMKAGVWAVGDPAAPAVNR